MGHVDHNSAREQLETIRTLMDRASTYRRALAPAMTSVGLIGTLAGLAAPFVIRDNARSFAFYWLAVTGRGVHGVLAHAPSGLRCR